MITTDPRAIALEIITEFNNLAAWVREFSDERLKDISETLAGVRQDDPAAGLAGAYRQEVLAEIDRRRNGKSPGDRCADWAGIQPPKPWPAPGKL